MTSLSYSTTRGLSARPAFEKQHQGRWWPQGVVTLAVLPDGRVVSGSDYKRIRIWPLDDGAPQVLEGHTGAVEALALPPDDRAISGSKDQSVRVWRFSVARGSHQGRLCACYAPVDCLPASAVGMIAAGCYDGTFICCNCRPSQGIGVPRVKFQAKPKLGSQPRLQEDPLR